MWKSKNDSDCVCWPFHPDPPPPPVPWITLALSDDPTETTQTRALWPRKCAFSARGVRRSGWWKVGWEGERLMEGDIFLGEGEAKFDDKASVVWNNRDIMTLWTHKNTHWHAPLRGTLTPSPPRHPARTWELRLKSVLTPLLQRRLCKRPRVSLRLVNVKVTSKNRAEHAASTVPSLCFLLLFFELMMHSWTER